MKDLVRVQMESYKPLRELVFEHIKESILEGGLTPGQRIMEIHLSEELGVSRTPVREAIRKLEREGLLVMEPRKGAYVARINVEDVVKVLVVKSSLEGLAASLAAQNRSNEHIRKMEERIEMLKKYVEAKDLKKMVKVDEEISDLIILMSENERIAMLMSELDNQVDRYRVTYYRKHEEIGDKVIQERVDLLEAIRNNDSEKAESLAREYVDNMIEFFEKIAIDGKIYEPEIESEAELD